MTFKLYRHRRSVTYIYGYQRTQKFTQSRFGSLRRFLCLNVTCGLLDEEEKDEVRHFSRSVCEILYSTATTNENLRATRIITRNYSSTPGQRSQATTQRDCRFGVQIPVLARHFSPLNIFHTGSGVHLAYYATATEVISRG